VVEQVRSGSSLRVYLVDSGEDFVVNLSGILCPSIKTKDNRPEDFALDAKFFTEHKLLNRTVFVTLDSTDKFNFYGTVLDEQENNIVFGLLEFGLASVVDWHIPTSGDAKLFHAAEQVAKDAKLRIWQQNNNNNKKQIINTKSAAVNGRVVEVNSLGTITVRVQENLEQKFHFSSIKVPRLPFREVSKDTKVKGNKNNQTEETDEQKKENEKKEKEKQQRELIEEKFKVGQLQRKINEMTPEARAEYYKKEQEDQKKADLEKELSVYAVLGREFLRKRLIGKTVRCVFDYQEKNKDKQQQQQLKNYFSIYEGKNNVALDLVRQGFANVINHIDPDQPRSAEYRDLVAAEREAQKNGLGLHTKNKPTPLVVNDLSTANEKKKSIFF